MKVPISETTSATNRLRKMGTRNGRNKPNAPGAFKLLSAISVNGPCPLLYRNRLGVEETILAPLLAPSTVLSDRLSGTYETLAGAGVVSVFLAENGVSRVLRITYSTGMKNRFNTVENNIPPTIAVPTECRPSLPAPVAK